MHSQPTRQIRPIRPFSEYALQVWTMVARHGMTPAQAARQLENEHRTRRAHRRRGQPPQRQPLVSAGFPPISLTPQSPITQNRAPSDLPAVPR